MIERERERITSEREQKKRTNEKELKRKIDRMIHR